MRCSASAPSGYLCIGCVTGLRIELVDVAGLIPDAHGKGTLVALPDELDTTLSKDDQLGDPNADPVTGGSGTPLIFKAHAAESLWVLHNVLRQWAAALGFPTTGMSPRELARWLVDHLGLVTKCPEAAELVDEVTDAIHQARRAIDRPSDDRLYLGQCGNQAKDFRGFPTTPGVACKEELYSPGPWIDVVTCPRCEAIYRVTERQEWLRERAQYFTGTADRVAGFLRATGVACSADRVRGFARSRHGRPPRIQRVGVDERGHALYSFDDVLDAISGLYQRRTPAQ